MSRYILVVVMTLVAACGRPPSEPRPSAPAATATTSSAAPQLMSGLGAHHHPIATASPEAQKFFDQGFAWVFAFNHEEGVRSFQRAAELDPKAAMPHWGIAWAVGPNYNLDVDDPRAKQAYRRDPDGDVARRQRSGEGARIRGCDGGHATRRIQRPTARRWRDSTAGPWAS